MYKLKVNCSWDLNIDVYYNKQAELYVDFYNFNEYSINDNIKILFVLEPHEIAPHYTQMAINMQNKFDFILTHNQEILEKCNNAILFEFGSTWINSAYDFPEKRFEVSALVGGKTATKGHRLRHGLWYNENKIKIPKNFYLSGNYNKNVINFNNNKILGKLKEPLFDSQFHIVIENVKRNNWFTEKLIDALYTKTIPIYYGCPNIENYFDTRGIFVVDSVKEIINVCNSLNENTYNDMIEYVEKNYETSKNFVDISERLKQKIDEFLK